MKTKTKSYIIAPIGELRFPVLDIPETKFSPRPEWSAGIFLNDADMRTIEGELRAAFAAAFPGRVGEMKLPIRTDKDGRRYVQARSTFAPKITDHNRNPIQTTVRHRDQGALLLNLKPYADEKGQGVVAYLSAVRIPSRSTSEKAVRSVGAYRAEPAVHFGTPLPF